MIDSNRMARLRLNATGYTPDPNMDRVLEMFHNDRDRYDRLSNTLKSQAGVYADFKAHYDAAVTAGAITAQETA